MSSQDSLSEISIRIELYPSDIYVAIASQVCISYLSESF